MSTHNTFAQDIESVLSEGEEIESIVILDSLSCSWDKKDPRDTPELLVSIGKILLWKDMRHLLDYPYNDGFGSMDCHDIVAWTPTKVIYIHEYDGSTSINYIPRNPIDYLMWMPN